MYKECTHPIISLSLMHFFLNHHFDYVTKTEIIEI